MKRINFLIHFTPKNRLFNFTLPIWVCGLVGGGILGLILLTGSLLRLEGRKALDRSRLTALEAENELLQRKLRRIESTFDTLMERMEELAQFETKLRVLTGLELVHPSLRRPGVGGNPDSLLQGLKGMRAQSYPLVRNVDERLEQLLTEARSQRESFEEIRGWLARQAHLLDHTPSIWPCRGWVISGFGYRTDPFTRKLRMHQGLDIAGPVGTPIVATADGQVKFAGPRMGYGLTVEIDHGYGYSTLYAHCHLLKVTAGDLVRRGDVIALLGSTGRSLSPHLHYEVRVSGVPVNPLQYIITELSFIE